MKFRIFRLILSLGLLVAVAAQADDLGSAVDDAAPDAADEPAPADDDSQTMRLSLDESIRLALQNNLDVEVQRFTPLVAGEQETEAWGAYDPEFFADFGYSDSEEPISFILQEEATSQGDSYNGFGGFRGLIPYFGSEYSFQFNGERTTTNLPVQAFSPEFRSSFSLSVSQPLLRGLIWNEAWTRVKTARIRYDESLENFRRRVMDTVQEVEDSYWNLIATSEQNRVARKSLETAEALLDQTETQYEVGVVSKVGSWKPKPASPTGIST
jgi:outer membrane protein